MSWESFTQACKNIHGITNITKYRNFQYLLLVGILPTNNQLFYWKKVPSQSCEFCMCRKQTLGHLLFFCERTQKLWSELSDFMIQCMNVTQLNYSYKNVMLNTVHSQPNHLCNFMVLVVKQYIYASKFRKKRFNINGALHKINELFMVEENNARINNRLAFHRSKWAPYTGEDLTIDRLTCVVNEYTANM